MRNNFKFIDQKGTFIIENCDYYRYLYFPLVNHLGMKSSITPFMNGDCKLDQNHFALLPVSEEDINNSLYARNIWFKVDDGFSWALSGVSPYQYLNKDIVNVKGGFLYQEVERRNAHFSTITTSFVVSDAFVEMHKVVLKNLRNTPLKVRPTVAVPLYSRSADNIRDHRHVTSLLNRAYINKSGIINRPTLSFDERGHQVNDTSYGVFAKTVGEIVNYWPTINEFVGKSNLLYPDKVVKNEKSNRNISDVISGYEVMGGLEFDEVLLNLNESLEIVFAILIDKDNESLVRKADYYLDNFDIEFDKAKIYWEESLSRLSFNLKDNDFSNWLKWVSLQPILRRLYGCSFLPHHDYGKGGRGWRDLWQDQLALILMNDDNVEEALYNNFAGIRIDGSNATIIGNKSGEFVADRNKIVRVWSDHAAWSLFTTKLFLDYSGKVDFLLRNQTYFKDQFSHYTKRTSYEAIKDNHLLDEDGNYYQGSILEHLIIQNIVQFYNVGFNGNVRLEDADWNDGLDMAHDHGETVAFTAFYANNLLVLSQILAKLNDNHIKEISLLKELACLLDFKPNFLPQEKQSILKRYFELVVDKVSKIKTVYKTKELSECFAKMASELKNHIIENEWLESDNQGWFNGYYDNDSNRIDNIEKGDIELTGQVFTILCGISSKDQIKKQIEACKQFLFNKRQGGYLLNTDFKEIKTNMGRLFGFAYGHKENGAMFSHMAMMFANGLLKQGFIAEGLEIIETIYEQVRNTEVSEIYPGIPEYFNDQGRGMYHYLTGSASWLIFTMVAEVFGIKASFGSLVFEPKLKKDYFIGKIAKVKKVIDGNLVDIIYYNNHDLDYDEYQISKVLIDGKTVDFNSFKNGIILKEKPVNTVELFLSKK